MDTRQPGKPLHWLAETKFHPPLLREDAIPRPRLFNALNNALTSHPLTLISAPAGYGKTTLLVDFELAEIGNPKSKIKWPGCPWTRKTTTPFVS